MKVFLPLFYLVIYLTISSSVAPEEWIYAALIAGLATGLVLAIRRMAGVDQRFRPGWAVRLVRPTAAVVCEVWPLTVALGRALGRRRRVGATLARRAFDPGESDGALGRGRRALVTIAISMSPASLVLERDVDCRELTIASVGVAEPGTADRRWPL